MGLTLKNAILLIIVYVVCEGFHFYFKNLLLKTQDKKTVKKTHNLICVSSFIKLCVFLVFSGWYIPLIIKDLSNSGSKINSLQFLTVFVFFQQTVDKCFQFIKDLQELSRED